jgi:hypothetical protein
MSPQGHAVPRPEPGLQRKIGGAAVETEIPGLMHNNSG